jgi:hypothetical protein
MVGLFGDNVLNVSWTQQLDTKYFWDTKHMLEPAYRVMNEKLLEMTGHEFPSEYKHQNLLELLDAREFGNEARYL